MNNRKINLNQSSEELRVNRLGVIETLLKVISGVTPSTTIYVIAEHDMVVGEDGLLSLPNPSFGTIAVFAEKTVKTYVIVVKKLTEGVGEYGMSEGSYGGVINERFRDIDIVSVYGIYVGLGCGITTHDANYEVVAILDESYMSEVLPKEFKESGSSRKYEYDPKTIHHVMSDTSIRIPTRHHARPSDRTDTSLELCTDFGEVKRVTQPFHQKLNNAFIKGKRRR